MPRYEPDTADGGARDPRVLLASVYGELRRLAHREMTGESRPATLQTTALVHEAWLRVAREARPTWEGSAQFFVAAAEAMRRIQVERARARGRLKRGGAHRRVAWDAAQLEATGDCGDVGAQRLLALDRALAGLRRFDARLARVVDLRVFAGMTETETAAVLGCSERSVRRDWRAGRLWLWQRIVREDAAAEGSAQHGT
jgi:RNA polymerase sigma factor (TIGR02999 family)